MSTVAALVFVWIVVIGAWWVKARSRAAGIRGDWNQEHWRRCKDCGMKLTRVEGEALRPHLGHKLHPAYGMGLFEYLRVLAGLL